MEAWNSWRPIQDMPLLRGASRPTESQVSKRSAHRYEGKDGTRWPKREDQETKAQPIRERGPSVLSV